MRPISNHLNTSFPCRPKGNVVRLSLDCIPKYRIIHRKTIMGWLVVLLRAESFLSFHYQKRSLTLIHLGVIRVREAIDRFINKKKSSIHNEPKPWIADDGMRKKTGIRNEELRIGIAILFGVNVHYIANRYCLP